MPWTDEQKLDYLMRQPWTIVREDSGESYALLRCKEMPDAVGSGDTDAELERDFWDSLRESLRARMHFGDTVPNPSTHPFPWEIAASKYPLPTVIVRRRTDGGMEVIRETAVTASSHPVEAVLAGAG